MPANSTPSRKVRCPKCTAIVTESPSPIYECPVCSTLLLAKRSFPAYDSGLESSGIRRRLESKHLDLEGNHNGMVGRDSISDCDHQKPADGSYISENGGLSDVKRKQMDGNPGINERPSNNTSDGKGGTSGGWDFKYDNRFSERGSCVNGWADSHDGHHDSVPASDLMLTSPLSGSPNHPSSSSSADDGDQIWGSTNKSSLSSGFNGNADSRPLSPSNSDHCQSQRSAIADENGGDTTVPIGQGNIMVGMDLMDSQFTRDQISEVGDTRQGNGMNSVDDLLHAHLHDPAVVPSFSNDNYTHTNSLSIADCDSCGGSDNKIGNEVHEVQHDGTDGRLDTGQLSDSLDNRKNNMGDTSSLLNGGSDTSDCVPTGQGTSMDSLFTGDVTSNVGDTRQCDDINSLDNCLSAQLHDSTGLPLNDNNYTDTDLLAIVETRISEPFGNCNDKMKHEMNKLQHARSDKILDLGQVPDSLESRKDGNGDPCDCVPIGQGASAGSLDATGSLFTGDKMHDMGTKPYEIISSVKSSEHGAADVDQISLFEMGVVERNSVRGEGNSVVQSGNQINSHKCTQVCMRVSKNACSQCQKEAYSVHSCAPCLHSSTGLPVGIAPDNFVEDMLLRSPHRHISPSFFQQETHMQQCQMPWKMMSSYCQSYNIHLLSADSCFLHTQRNLHSRTHAQKCEPIFPLIQCEELSSPVRHPGLLTRRKRHHPPLPCEGAMPYFICKGCSLLLQVPQYHSLKAKFILKLSCGGCGKASKFSLPYKKETLYFDGFQAELSKRSNLLSNDPVSTLPSVISHEPSSRSPYDSINSTALFEEILCPTYHYPGSVGSAVEVHSQYQSVCNSDSFFGYSSPTSKSHPFPSLTEGSGIARDGSENKKFEEVPQEEIRRKQENVWKAEDAQTYEQESPSFGDASFSHDYFCNNDITSMKVQDHVNRKDFDETLQRSELNQPTKVKSPENSSIDHRKSPAAPGSPLIEHFAHASKVLGPSLQQLHSSQNPVTQVSSVLWSPPSGSSLYDHLRFDALSYLDEGSPQREPVPGKLEAARSHDASKGPKYYAGLLRKRFYEFRKGSHGRHKRMVMINGHLIPDASLKSAEEQAGPIHPGSYWYDYQAGFWGMMDGPCLGIIPPFIEEFNFELARDCAGGTTGILVNGRELHVNDLQLLHKRGLSMTSGRAYIIDIMGEVMDAASGQRLQSIGKLAPSLERAGRGCGIFNPETRS